VYDAQMRLYLDLCCFNRPFDCQSQSKIWIESQAVMRIFDLAYVGALDIVSSAALIMENDDNPKLVRRERVSILLQAFGEPYFPDDAVFHRARDLTRQGFGSLDALHIACAEGMAVDFFLTCDRGILKKRERPGVSVEIRDPVEFLKELDL